MKGFVISICIVIIIFSLVGVNSFYVKRVMENLKKSVDELKPQDHALMSEVTTLWKKNKFFICLSSSTKETDKIDDMISALEAMYEHDSFLGLEEKKALLINYISLISSHERLSLENII